MLPICVHCCGGEEHQDACQKWSKLILGYAIGVQTINKEVGIGISLTVSI